MQPRLDLYAKDGSIFTKEPVEIILPEQGLIQYKVSNYVIRHEGKIDCKLFLYNGNESVHVANFYFVIKDSGVTGAVGKEIKGDILQDMVRDVMSENAMGLLDDEYKDKINQDVVEYISSNPELYKGPKGEKGEQGPQGQRGVKGDKGDTLKYAERSTSEKEEMKSNISDQAVTAFVLEDGVIKTSKLSNDAVAREKTSFLKTGKNIFNKNDVLLGKILSYTTGKITDNKNYVSSNYIPVIPNTNYIQNYSEIVLFYTQNKTFISGIARGQNAKESRVIATPTNAYYIRTTTLNEGVDSYNYKMYQIELGNVSTEYEDYYEYIENLQAGIPDNFVGDNHIKDNAITLEKLSIVETSQNVFDKRKAAIGHYVNPTTGVLSVNANYYYSNYINVQGETKVTKSTANNLYAFYDSNKQFIPVTT